MTRSGRTHRPRGRWILAASFAASAALVLSACGGSVLAPEDVALANDRVRGAGTGSNQPGSVSGAQVGGSDSGVDGGETPGVNTPGGGDDGTDPTTPGGGSNPGGGIPGGSQVPAGGNGAKPGSCAGFKNSTGISDSTIKIASIVDITGPVPGFFTPSLQATQAYVKYFNSTSDLCGRKFQVVPYDSQTSAGADAVAAQRACDEAFASVGSMGGFDSGGASITQKCGMPDLRAIATNQSRTDCTTCFSAEGPRNGRWPNAVTDYFLKHDKPATQKAAMLYVGEAASVDNAKIQIKAEERRGWKFVYTSQFDVAEFNYAPYVQKMKERGAQIVQFYGASGMAARVAGAMANAGYKPKYFMVNAAIYDETFAKSGPAVNGTVAYIDFAPLEEVKTNPEMALYYKWLQQVSPGAKMSYFGLFSWSATRLFVERAVALGGQLTRANMVKSIRQVHKWSANGLHAPQDVGGETNSLCWRLIKLDDGTWKPYGGTKYFCGGTTSGT